MSIVDVPRANLNLSDRVIDNRCSRTWRRFARRSFEPVMVRDGKCQGAIGERVMILAWSLSIDLTDRERDSSRTDTSRVTAARSAIAQSQTRSRASRFEDDVWRIHVCIIYTCTYRFLRRTCRRDLVGLVSDWTTQTATLYTGRLRRRVHPGFLGLLNRYVYASNAIILHCNVPDKLVDEINLFKREGKNSNKFNLRSNAHTLFHKVYFRILFNYKTKNYLLCK